MKKRELRKKMLPVVIVSFQDHSAHLEGMAEAVRFTAIGVILKETPMATRWVIGFFQGSLWKRLVTSPPTSPR